MKDEQLIEIAQGWRDGILDGRPPDFMCAAVCWPLQGYLSSMHGIEAEAVEADLGVCNHIWLLMPDGRALDPTGDQFNWCNDQKMPPVYLGPPMKIHTRGFDIVPYPPPRPRERL